MPEAPDLQAVLTSSTKLMTEMVICKWFFGFVTVTEITKMPYMMIITQF